MTKWTEIPSGTAFDGRRRVRVDYYVPETGERRSLYAASRHGWADRGLALFAVAFAVAESGPGIQVRAAVVVVPGKISRRPGGGPEPDRVIATLDHEAIRRMVV